MEFRVKQGGMVVASGDCPTEDEMRREATHYAVMYAWDGTPVDVEYRIDGKWQQATNIKIGKAA